LERRNKNDVLDSKRNYFSKSVCYRATSKNQESNHLKKLETGEKLWEPGVIILAICGHAHWAELAQHGISTPKMLQ
jgi:hypothetical protein